MRRSRAERAARALARLAAADEAVQRQVLKSLSEQQRRELAGRWRAWAHEGQLPPEGNWRVWLMMAGRGFGKTRAGAEWVSELARRDGTLRIALVGATVDDVRKVMIEGESGLRAVAGWDEDLFWIPTAGTVTFGSGAMAFVYSGENPEKLRGPQHHFAWCDELAKWSYPDATWDNLRFGLRLGQRPQALVTTTPRPIPTLTRIMAGKGTVVTGGRSVDNPHLSQGFISEIVETYGGTRLGRQELDGELIEDVAGSLWPRALIEQSRASRAGPEDRTRDYVRVVVGVDPPATSRGDACGIVAVGLGRDDVAYVIGDHSVAGLSPEGWARRVAAAYEAEAADRIIVENNNGGEMVESVLRGAALNLPVKPAFASRGKVKRAEPVAALFEKGRAKFAGTFPELEDELAGFTSGGGYEGPGRSPDRADAMVWAMTELMLGKVAVPRVREL